MFRKLRSLAIFLFPACLCAASTLSQIAPVQDTPAPLTTSAAPAALVSPADGKVDASIASLKAIIQGWSLTSETDTSATQTGDAVRLEPGNRDIVFFFGARPANAGATEFRYQLSGYDAGWTVTRSSVAHYRRLLPGRYRLVVQARSNGGAWSASNEAMTVEQRPFFYQTWYFYLLLAVGGVVLAAQLLQQRDQLMKGQMGIVLEERNRIASDCHDTLMAGFAAISWQLEATAKLFRDTGSASTPAASSCELARSMVSHCQSEARRIIWDLRDSDELTNNLSQALGRALAGHRLRDSVSTKLDVQGEEIPIAPGAVHHLVCIGQEAVTNAMRHAQASEIYVGIYYETDSLVLTVRDNGRGFQLSENFKRSGHFGIPVMQERARKLGGTLRLNSSAHLGTEVVVTVGFQSINTATRKQQHVVPWIGV